MRIPTKTLCAVVVGTFTGLLVTAYAATPQAKTQAEAASPPARPTVQAATPQAASQQTVVIAPTPTEPQVTVTATPLASRAPSPREPSASAPTATPTPAEPSTGTPAEPTPETITLNLKTPQTYTISAGAISPTLSHQMIDKTPYEWQSGLNTYWLDETPPATTPVWAVISLTKPSTPYISDQLPFTIHAGPDTQPGTYKVRFTLLIRPGVSLDIPVVVTVPPSPATATPAADGASLEP